MAAQPCGSGSPTAGGEKSQQVTQGASRRHGSRSAQRWQPAQLAPKSSEPPAAAEIGLLSGAIDAVVAACVAAGALPQAQYSDSRVGRPSPRQQLVLPDDVR